MHKRYLTAEQIGQELHKRILGDESAFPCPKEDCYVPVPKSHPTDSHGRNWDVTPSGHDASYAASLRSIVEEARREYFLSDLADHDELVGAAFTHA